MEFSPCSGGLPDSVGIRIDFLHFVRARAGFEQRLTNLGGTQAEFSYYYQLDKVIRYFTLLSPNFYHIISLRAVISHRNCSILGAILSLVLPPFHPKMLSILTRHAILRMCVFLFNFCVYQQSHMFYPSMTISVVHTVSFE